MTLNSDVKFKGKLNCDLKNDMKNLVNFHAGSQKSDIIYFDGLLLSKVYKVLQLKSKVELCVMILKSNAKFKENMNYGFKNDRKNLMHFHPRTQNPENLPFKRIFLSKEYNVSARKL